MRNLTCCYTGHRAIPEHDVENVRESLVLKTEALIKRGIIYFGCGGAVGFDTLAAEAVIELRKKYPFIRLIMVLPCKNQDEKWSLDEKIRYDNIKQNADKIIYTSEHYIKGCMFKRNRHLVDHSAVCIAYVRKTTGGTAYTIKYATEKNLEIILV